MLKGLLSKERRNRGFTMTEILTVIGIIVIIVAIAVPSVIMINNNTRFKQCNEYAQVIFTAAQNNLTQMRSDGRLDQLGTNLPPAQTLQRQDFPASGIVYTYNGQPDFNLVLPADAVENTLRDETIIIEYNPKTGVIFSAFYSEDEGILERYQNGSLKLDADIRKKEKVGYYPNPDPDDIVLGDAAMESYTIEGSALAFENGEAEGVLTMSIPVSVGTDTVLHSRNYKQLAVKLTVTGEISGNVVTKTINVADLNLQQGDSATIVDNAVQISCILDSLDGSQFVGFEDENGAVLSILPGENVTITAETIFNQGEDDPLIIVPPYTLNKVNPLFHALEKNDAGIAELKISNVRNLLNLNLVAEEVANTVNTVSFVSGNGNEEATPIIRLKDVAFTPIVNPALFGAIDKENAEASATTQVSVKGNGAMIYGLTINDANENNAGLFASLNVPVEGINLVNPAIDGGARTGALAGAAGPNAVITSCRVVIDKTDTGWSDTVSYGVKGADVVGGLVGDVFGSRISNCEVAIPVSGVAGENAAEGFGGIAGVAQNATVENSTVHVNGVITDGTFGGAVGTAVDKVTLENLTVTVGGSILGTEAEKSKENGISADRIGGLVGKSTGELTISGSEVTLKAIDRQKGIAMVGDHVAGLVCTAEKLVMSNTAVNIEDSLEGKDRAAGAVCETGKNSNISGVTVRLGFINAESNTDDKWEARRIDGDKQVAGFACLLKGTVKNCTVAGRGSIGSTSSDHVAGFAVTVGASKETGNSVQGCRVIPAYDVNSNTFKFMKTADNAYLDIQGSGFAVDNFGTVKNCVAVGTVKDNGFVKDNKADGKIEKSTANVGGTKAFAGANSGSISYCYGWTKEAVKEVSGTVKSSYFADMKGGVILYDTEGKKQESSTAALTEESTLTLLDPETDAAKRTWKLGTTNKTYAFGGATTAYPYPMVQDHYGSWATVEEACGVLYYEKYKDGSYGAEVVTLADAPILPFSKDNTAAALNDTQEITEAGYALFCKKDTKPFDGATNKLIGDLIDAEGLRKAANLDDRYGVYKLTAASQTPLTGPKTDDSTAAMTVTVNPKYAAAFNVTNNTYRIRTADQFKAIGSTGTYTIERDLTVGNASIATFGGTLNGNGKTITVDSTGSLIGTLTGGKVSNLTVKGSINVAGVTTSVGGVFGKVSGGTVENVTSEVVFSGTATGKIGMFVGEATGGTFKNCHSAAANTQYPFGHIASTDESVSGKPTHTSQKKLANGDYTDLSEFTAVDTAVTKKKFAATLDNCTFMLSGVKTNALVEDVYFYEVTKVYTPVDAYKQVAAPAYAALNATADAWTKTDYFVKDGSTYKPLYVKTVITTSEVDGTQATQYEFGTDGSTAKWTSEVIADPSVQVSITGLDFFAQVNTVEPGTYRLVPIADDGTAPECFKSDWIIGEDGKWNCVNDPNVNGTIVIENDGSDKKATVTIEGKQYVCTVEKLSDAQKVTLVDTGYKVAGVN